MKKNEAIDLLAGLPPLNAAPSQWADLGCGTGLFTVALAHYLAKGSTIYGVDTVKVAPPDISPGEQISILPLELDFVKENLPLTGLSGILMANSLHYVQDKPAFLDTVKTRLLPQHHWILAEYDTDASNPWVPFPVSFNRLQKLFADAGYRQGMKLKERRSVYGRANIYTACFTSG